MTTVLLQSAEPPSQFLGQTENGKGTHQEISYTTDVNLLTDWFVGLDTVPDFLRTHVPKSRRILVVTEPPNYKTYVARFSNQFGIAISPHELPGYGGRWIKTQSALQWLYGIEFLSFGQQHPYITLNGLRQMPVPCGKLSRLSVVSSNLDKLPRHRDRLRLIVALRSALPGQVDVFGRGFKNLRRKSDGISPYRYHLAIENNDVPHFWTEKIADAYLGYALPIYSGCENITSYFPASSMIQLGPLRDINAAIATVRDVLARDPWEGHLGAIQQARSRLIEEYNFFTVINKIILSAPIASMQSLGEPEVLRGLPHPHAGMLGLARKAVHLIKRRAMSVAGY